MSLVAEVYVWLSHDFGHVWIVATLLKWDLVFMVCAPVARPLSPLFLPTYATYAFASRRLAGCARLHRVSV